MKKGNKRYIFKLPAHMKEYLQWRSKNSKVSIAETLRRIIDDYMEDFPPED